MAGRYVSGFITKVSASVTAHDPTYLFSAKPEHNKSASWNTAVQVMNKTLTLGSARAAAKVLVHTQTVGHRSETDLESTYTMGSVSMAKYRLITVELRFMEAIATEMGMDAKMDTEAVNGVHVSAKGINPTSTNPNTDRGSSDIIRPMTMEVGWDKQ